jgi:hypothetical protein
MINKNSSFEAKASETKPDNFSWLTYYKSYCCLGSGLTSFVLWISGFTEHAIYFMLMAIWLKK